MVSHWYTLLSGVQHGRSVIIDWVAVTALDVAGFSGEAQLDHEASHRIAVSYIGRLIYLAALQQRGLVLFQEQGQRGTTAKQQALAGCRLAAQLFG